ncbi:hypothetical protein HYALB_00000627 [Hymenoscyphus albidus]|uniref:Uncharacterized protein n=1 Tax=Hymenoscyphus albidus TaxID=595503 RepID=A0A9N9Q2I9_9HELO|nr:hypothetical protein HYALB_00000627 [Hymenoscyphus albidus]
MYFALLFSFLAFANFATPQSWSIFDSYNQEWSSIHWDVCIVGGGSSGIYAAVSLKDSGKTVVVVERNNYLGGHAHTYFKSNTPVDFGVVIFQPIPEVTSYFERFSVRMLNLRSPEVIPNIPGHPANKSLPAVLYATNYESRDFRDGSKVNPTAFSDTEVSAAFAMTTNLLANYKYLLHGYDLPDPVPEDLYLPYGAFVKKYHLAAAFPKLFHWAGGLGDVFHLPANYVLKYFNAEVILYAFKLGHITPASGSTHELYSKAGDFIGADNILLDSNVIATNRKASSSTGTAELLVSTKDSGLKLLNCKKILLTIPPTLTNLRGWDLTPAEHSVFSQFTTSNGYWTGLVTNVGLNQTVAILNNAAHTPGNVPIFPALYELQPVGVLDDVWYIKFGANNPTMTTEQVKSYVESEIAILQKAYNVPVTKPEWLMDSHTPFHLQVSPEAIKNGFYNELQKLQGGLGGTMFYSGAAFHTQASSLLWRFNKEVVLPMMMKSF